MHALADRFRATMLVAVIPLGAACELSGDRAFSVVSGPAVPSSVPTAVPFVWDSREELAIWVENPVTRGPVPVSLSGDGAEAVVLIQPRRGATDGWVLRGPDLDPPAHGVRSVRLRYRWSLDPTLSPNAANSFTFRIIVEALNAPRPPEQPTAYVTLQPSSEWTTRTVNVGSSLPLDVKHVYLHQFSSNPGLFELDWIQLVGEG